MQNTIRVRKNRSAALSAPQVKTPPEKTVIVVFFDREDHHELARVEFPESIYAKIVHASKKLKVTLDQFFTLAVNEKFARELPGVAAYLSCSAGLKRGAK